MKYLLDQGLPRSTVEYLRELGIASEHVGNLGMAQAPIQRSLRQDETMAKLSLLSTLTSMRRSPIRTQQLRQLCALE